MSNARCTDSELLAFYRHDFIILTIFRNFCLIKTQKPAVKNHKQWNNVEENGLECKSFIWFIVCCLDQEPQHSDAGEARTRGPRFRVKHSTTEPLCSLFIWFL